MIELKNYMLRNKFKPYNAEAKERFKKLGKRFCNKLIKQCEPLEKFYSYNEAGIACSGDHSIRMKFPNNNFIYVSFNADNICNLELLYRTMNHIKDYSGNENHWCSWSSLESLPEKIKLLIKGE